MNKVKLASLLGVALTISSVSVSAGVEYDDTDLHRSDDMVRFDRAYRAGLKDGTTTIIYSGSKAPGAVPDQPEQSRASSGVSDRQANGRVSSSNGQGKQYADSGRSGTYRSDPGYSDDLDDVPEKMQDPSQAEKRRFPTRNDQEGKTTRREDCDCEPTKPTAPKSERATPSDAAERDSDATMREKIDAVRKARELLRKSREESGIADSGHGDGDDSGKKDASGTPRLIDHAESPSTDMAPLGPYELDPDFVRNQEVSIDVDAATIEEIATRLMPRGWRVRLSTSDQEIHGSTYEFVSSDPREVALRKLLIGTGLGYKMFFNLKDDHGKPSPLLVISEVNS